MQVSRERQRWLTVALVVAVAAHLLFVVPLVYLLIPDPEGRPVAVRSVPIRPYQLLLEPEETAEQEPRQIVSIDAPETAERPDEARFEDRVNRRVDEEMRARDRGGPVLVTPQPTRPEPERRPRPAEREEREVRRVEAVEAPEVPAEPVEEEIVDDELAAAFEPNDRGSQPSRRSRPHDPNRERDVEEPSESRLDLSAFAPSLATASEFVAVPGAPSHDFLDLPQGDRDQLNSYENMYWSYWDRIKNQVRPHWRPSRVYRERDPTGRVFGVEDRYTVLRVTLNGDGSLRHVYLERSSDLDFLDREAIRAVRAAQPFANVPEGLKDERGLLSFRFGFYFEVSSASFRIRREDW